MKRILRLPTLLLLAMTTMFLFSCESDPVTPEDRSPVVTLTSDADITVEPTEVFTIDITASKGGDDSPLKTVTVYEDGTKLPAERLTYNGTAASANAALLFGDDVDGLTWSIDVVAQSSASTTVTFEVEVADEAGEKQSVLVNVTTVGTPPTLTASPPTAFEIQEGSINAFKLTAVKGTGDLFSIEVRENNVKVDASRLNWNGESMVGMDNPFLLSENEKGGFGETRLELDLPMSVGVFTYTMILTDEFSLMDTVEYVVTTTPSGTAIEMREDVIMNADGPGVAGGLDLNTGMETEPFDTSAEIVDNGINVNLPLDQNWLRTISPVNDSNMKYLIPGQGGLPETFLFADVVFKEDLVDFFNNGVELTNGTTDVVQIEDVFIVEKDGDYWMLEVIEIVTDPSGNDDSYRFDIKY